MKFLAGVATGMVVERLIVKFGYSKFIQQKLENGLGKLADYLNTLDGVEASFTPHDYSQEDGK